MVKLFKCGHPSLTWVCKLRAKLEMYPRERKNIINSVENIIILAREGDMNMIMNLEKKNNG